MTTTGIKLDKETHRRLRHLAKAKDRSVHWLMKEAIGRYVTEEERYEREKAEDEARYQHYLDTGTHISNEDLMGFVAGLRNRARQEPGPE